jgi:hypothetical protein
MYRCLLLLLPSERLGAAARSLRVNCSGKRARGSRQASACWLLRSLVAFAPQMNEINVHMILLILKIIRPNFILIIVQIRIKLEDNVAILRHTNQVMRN